METENIKTLEQWDASREKANELRIEQWGTNTIEPWKFALNPNKDNTGLKARRYLYAPMEYNGKIMIVKITVKEYEGTDLQNNLYSIEAINVDLKA